MFYTHMITDQSEIRTKALIWPTAHSFKSKYARPTKIPLYLVHLRPLTPVYNVPRRDSKIKNKNSVMHSLEILTCSVIIVDHWTYSISEMKTEQLKKDP